MDKLFSCFWDESAVHFCAFGLVGKSVVANGTHFNARWFNTKRFRMVVFAGFSAVGRRHKRLVVIRNFACTFILAYWLCAIQKEDFYKSLI